MQVLKLSGVRVINSYLKHKDIRAWHLRRTFKESHEIYVIDSYPEALRCNTVTDYSLLLHTNKKNNGMMGESKAEFQLFPGGWKEVVDETISRSHLIENPEYELPEKWESKQSLNPIYDTSVSVHTAYELKNLHQEVNGLSDDFLLGCNLASFEIFLEVYDTKIENSHGLSLHIPSTKILWDFVLMSPDKEVEINCFQKRRFLKGFDWGQTLQKEARQLIDLQEARLPPTGTFPVVMADEALDTIFDYFTAQADGGALYYKYSSFKAEHSVYKKQKDALEPLTLKTDPTLMGGMRSGFFEELGYPLSPVTIIEKGILKNFTIGGKLSYLLQMPRTSSMSNVIVEPGKIKYSDFLKDGVFELLRFSTFHPNPITGAFSGEIRLGYLHKRGKKIPIKGGSVSGVSQESFLRAHFSEETVTRESYQGPSGIFFKELTLAGS